MIERVSSSSATHAGMQMTTTASPGVGRRQVSSVMRAGFKSPSSRAHQLFSSTQARLLVAVMIVSAAVVGLTSHDAQAARVSGVLTGYESSSPLVSRDLHFQNRITGDIYLSPTHRDGSFAVTLPPGVYSLRTETGAVLVSRVVVGPRDVALGNVSELARFAPQRWFQSQMLAPTILSSSPPSTAFVMTADTTPLPADAAAVRKPEVDWSKPPPETQASAPNTVTGMETGPVAAPQRPSTAMPGAPSGPGAGSTYLPMTAPGEAAAP
jgi:hypothetical protein